MRHSRYLALSTLPLLFVSSWVMAGHKHHDNHDYAKVISVQPIVHTVTTRTPHERCRVVTTVQRSRSNHAAPIILGGVVGGVIGHQFGDGRGHDAATVIGTVIGATLGHRAAHRSNEPRTVVTERCRVKHVHHVKERVTRYHVTYRHHGRRYRTELPYHPGHKMRVDARPQLRHRRHWD